MRMEAWVGAQVKRFSLTCETHQLLFFQHVVRSSAIGPADSDSTLQPQYE